MKRRKKTARQRQYDILDRLWQQLIVLLADGKCELCDAPAYCGHHVFTKATSTFLRWEIHNGVAVCAKCHLKCHSSHSTEMVGKIIRLFGEARWLWLETHCHKIAKFSMDDLREIEARLNEERRQACS